MNNLIEIYEIITADGETFIISDEHSFAVIDSAGNGMPGFIYNTRRGYKADRAFVDGFNVEPRAVTLTLAGNTSSRDAYWLARAALLDFLRPNRGGALTLRHRRENGDAFDLNCWIVAASPDSDFGFDLQQTIELIAFDPFWYSIDETSILFSTTTGRQLVFPITFPISFGSDNSFAGTTITYTGTWVAYPRIEVTGPYSSFMVVHSEAESLIRLNTQIFAGESRIIELEPDEKKYIQDGGGVSRMDELLMPDSNLVNFSLRPVGIFDQDNPFSGVPAGTNTINANATGVGAETTVTLKYKERYLGLGV